MVFRRPEKKGRKYLTRTRDRAAPRLAYQEYSRRARQGLNFSNFCARRNKALTYRHPLILTAHWSTVVYSHARAWSCARRTEHLVLHTWIVLHTWKSHRHIGMSGKSFVRELLRKISPTQRQVKIDRPQKRHDHEFKQLQLQILRGARELLRHLERIGAQWAIATTSSRN